MLNPPTCKDSAAQAPPSSQKLPVFAPSGENPPTARYGRLPMSSGLQVARRLGHPPRSSGILRQGYVYLEEGVWAAVVCERRGDRAGLMFRIGCDRRPGRGMRRVLSVCQATRGQPPSPRQSRCALARTGIEIKRRRVRQTTRAGKGRRRQRRRPDSDPGDNEAAAKSTNHARPQGSLQSDCEPNIVRPGRQRADRIRGAGLLPRSTASRHG